MKVKGILNLLPSNQATAVVFYAYGCHWGDTYKDGMRTAKECLDQVSNNLLATEVFKIEDQDRMIVIHATLTK